MKTFSPISRKKVIKWMKETNNTLNISVLISNNMKGTSTPGTIAYLPMAFTKGLVT